MIHCHTLRLRRGRVLGRALGQPTDAIPKLHKIGNRHIKSPPWPASFRPHGTKSFRRSLLNSMTQESYSSKKQEIGGARGLVGRALVVVWSGSRPNTGTQTCSARVVRACVRVSSARLIIVSFVISHLQYRNTVSSIIVMTMMADVKAHSEEARRMLNAAAEGDMKILHQARGDVLTKARCQSGKTMKRMKVP